MLRGVQGFVILEFIGIYKNVNQFFLEVKTMNYYWQTAQELNFPFPLCGGPWEEGSRRSVVDNICQVTGDLPCTAIENSWKNKSVVVSYSPLNFGKIDIAWLINGKKLETAYFPEEQFEYIKSCLLKYKEWRGSIDKSLLAEIADKLVETLPFLSSERIPLSFDFKIECKLD